MEGTSRNRIIAVVLYHNALETIGQVIEGIRNQARKVECIVVVDNASEVDLSDRYKDDLDIRFIRSDTNLGVGAGHNLGWKIAINDLEGDLIWSLEHDAIPKVDCLEKLIAQYRPETLAAIGPVEDDGLDYKSKEYYIFNSHGIKKLSDKKEKEIYKGGMSFNGILIPVSLLLRVGFLNEDFFVGREDFDFYRRIYHAGGHVLRVPKAQVLHNLHKEKKPIHFFNKVFLFPRQSLFREYYSYRNAVYMAKKNGASKISLYSRHLLGILTTLLFRNSKLARVNNRNKAFRNGWDGKLGK